MISNPFQSFWQKLTQPIPKLPSAEKTKEKAYVVAERGTTAWINHEERQQENIKQIAHQLYQNRQLMGQSGDAQSDWLKAEKIGRCPVRTVLFASNRSLIKLRKTVTQVFKFILVSLPSQEWVKLVAAPVILAVATSIITNRFQQEANQNAILKEYFDQLEKLTFAHDLLKEEPNKEAIILAQGRTVVALHQLDRERRTELMSFLQASGLSKYGKKKPVISFSHQNLTGLDLYGMDLSLIEFDNANLYGANLSSAFLYNTYLRHAFLSFANLHDANLRDANLCNANLRDANLSNADLSGADLRWADLSNADLSWAILLATDLRNSQGLEQLEKLEEEKQPLICNLALSGSTLSSSLSPTSTLSYSRDRDCGRIPEVLHERYPQDFPTLDNARKYTQKKQQKKWWEENSRVGKAIAPRQLASAESLSPKADCQE
jgi:uncharacterized protein YjbI with pentapeptide repeats